MKRSCALLLFLCLLLSGCKAQTAEAQGFAFDTILTVRLFGGGEALAQEALSLADAAERRLSCHLDGTEIAALNAGGEVTLSASTADLLALSLDVYDKSGGALDIGLGGVSALWDFKSVPPALPDEDALEEALSHAGADKLALDGARAHLTDPQAQIDLGAVAKGALADEMAAFLTEEGVSSFLLDLGGCICVRGGKDGAPFRIGVEDPRDGGILGVVSLQSGVASTSSGAQRGFTLDGKRYHHILDPSTGYPAEAGLLSVTVFSDSGALADALSTACFVLGEEGAAELLALYPGTSALLLTDKGETRIIGEVAFTPST